MINIPTEVEQYLADTSVRKNMRIVFVDGSLPDINNDTILQDTFVMTESICSGDGIRFGSTDANEIKFSCVTQNSIKGKEIECYLEIDVTDIEYPEREFYYSDAMDCWAFPIYYGKYKIVSCKRKSDDIGVREVEAYSWGYEDTVSTKIVNYKRDLSPIERMKLNIPVLQNIPYTFNSGYFLYSNVKGLEIDDNFTQTRLTPDISGALTETDTLLTTGCSIIITYYTDTITLGYDDLDYLYYIENKFFENGDALLQRIAHDAAMLTLRYSPNPIDYDTAYEHFYRTLSNHPKTKVAIHYPYGDGTSRIATHSGYDSNIYPFINVPKTSQSKVNCTIYRTSRIRGVQFKYSSTLVDIGETIDFGTARRYYRCAFKSDVISPVLSAPRTFLSDDDVKLFSCDDLTYSLIDYTKAFNELNAQIGRYSRFSYPTYDGERGYYKLGYIFTKLFDVPSGTDIKFLPRIMKSDYHMCWYDDERILYGKVICRFTENDEDAAVSARIKKPDGTYYKDDEEFLEYDLSDNMIVKDTVPDRAVLQKAVNKIAEQLNKLNFYGIVLDCRGLPYIEVGDWVRVQISDDEMVSAMVLNRSISGINDLMDDISTETYKD